MKRAVLLCLLLAATVALACEEIVSPVWFVLDRDNNPVSVNVFETSGREKLELTFESKSGVAHIDLKKPTRGYEWAYGTCAPNKNPDSSIFALVRKPDEAGWAPDIQAAYRINPEGRTVEKVSTAGLYCFSRGF